MRGVLLPVMVTLLLLGGCAGTPFSPLSQPEAAYEDREEALLYLNNWIMAGRLSVQREEEGWHANFTWKNAKDHFDMRIHGPAGSGSAKVYGSGPYVVMHTPDGRVYTATEGNDVVEQEFGFKVPVRQMGFWARGIPYPYSRSERVVNEAGLLQGLTQDGWKVEFLEYEPQAEPGTQGAPLVLPTRLVATNEQGSTTRVKVIIDSWQLP